MSGAATVPSSRVGRLSQLDASVQARLDAACNYINAEVAKVRGRLIKGAIIGGVLALVVTFFVRDPRGPFAAAAVIVAFYALRQWKALNAQYKQIVVGRVVAALGNEMTYSPTSAFSKQDFLDMDVYERRAERWSAEDEVSGRKGAVTYSILEGKATRTEGSGKNRRTVTIFKGTIARLDFNKNFVGHTVVVPDGESRSLFGEASTRRKKELCRLENVTFESRYSVYGTDQQQARYILTPKMMELILEASAAHPNLRMSFHDNSLFVTMPSSANRFELKWSGEITPDVACGELIEVVQLADRLIDMLHLETRIWTRQ